MKTLRIALAFSIGAVFLLTACHKDKAGQAPYLNTNKTTVNALTGAFKDTIKISSNTDWNITAIPSWLTVTPTTGHGDANIELSFNSNEALNSRNATLSISVPAASSTTLINVTQAGTTPSLLTDKTTLQEKGEGQQDSLTITSNVPWKLDIPADAGWITADKTSGTAGISKIYFTIDANGNGSAKSTVISISSTGATVNPVNVTVNQPQPDVTIASFTEHQSGGNTIIIEGSGFSSTAAGNKVQINGVDATVTSAWPTGLEVTVPQKVGSGKISISVGTKTAVSTTDFIYDWVGTVNTIAGKAGIVGHADDMGTAATFYSPSAIAVDGSGNLYIADQDNNLIRKISADGQVITLAGKYGVQGHADGTGSAATFYYPSGIAVDKNNNIYVADSYNHLIRKISSTGVVSTLAGKAAITGHADGTGTAATFYYPVGVATDSDGNIYVADAGNNLIRKISPAGEVITLAGNATISGHDDGAGTAASFNYPTGVAVSADGNIYVADRDNSLIRKITATGTVSTLAGQAMVTGHSDGTGSGATFNRATGMGVGNDGYVYVADASNQLVRRIDPSGVAQTLAGRALIPGSADGTSINASFYAPSGIVVDGSGNIYIADKVNNLIRKMVVR